MLYVRYHHYTTRTKRAKNVVMKGTLNVRRVRLLPSNAMGTKITNIRTRNSLAHDFRLPRRVRRLLRHRFDTIVGNTIYLYGTRRNQIRRATHVSSTINLLGRNHTPPNSRIQYTKTYAGGVCRGIAPLPGQ